MSASAVYEGWVRHRRFEPVEHSFRYRLFLMYLDLDELPGVLDPFPLFSARRPAPARFRRADYMGDPRPAAGRVRPRRGRGRDRQPPRPARCACSPTCATSATSSTRSASTTASTRDGERVEAVVADVNNIPWGERHPYVLARGSRRGAVLSDELDKTLHVSPLMGMDQTYAFRAGEPGERLSVHIESRPRRTCTECARAFDATLSLRRHELSRARADRDARPLPGDVAAGRSPRSTPNRCG